MGHRSYLNIATQTQHETFFEANNSLPFFWIALLNETLITNHKSHWLYYQSVIEQGDELEIEHYTDIVPHPTTFFIEREVFIEKVKLIDAFLKQHYPNSTLLFNDFVQYISSFFNDEGDGIELELIAFANFTSIPELLQDLYQEVKSIETNRPTRRYLFENDLVGSGTGFSTFGFDKISERYQLALEKRTGEIKAPKVEKYQTFNVKSLLKHILILLLCPIFSYAVYKGFLREGFSITVISISVCNLIFYTFSAYGIKANWEDYKLEKK